MDKGLMCMKKVDPTVLKETGYILKITVLLSVLMQSVFLVVGYWDYTVLLGNVLGIFAAVGNFFLMGLTVQAALGKEEKDAKNLVKVSQLLRMLFLFVVALIGYLVPLFHTVAMIVPYVFPRIAIALRPLLVKS